MHTIRQRESKTPHSPRWRWAIAVLLCLSAVFCSAFSDAATTDIYATSIPAVSGWNRETFALGSPSGKSCDANAATGGAWQDAAYPSPYVWLVCDNFTNYSPPAGESISSIALAVYCGREPGKGTASIDVNFFGTGITSTTNTISWSTDNCNWRGNYEILGPVPAGSINNIQVKFRRHSPYLAGDIYVLSVRLRITSSDLTPPTTTVSSPNGGETWGIGSSQTVSWSASDFFGVSSINLEYSLDGGGSWAPIASGLGNTGSYPWAIPNAPTTQALIRATAFDGSGNQASDVSNGSFTIRDLTPPAAMVFGPNGGEILGIGSTQNITWGASDNIGVTSVTLEYSTNGGVSYAPIASGLSNSGSYSWLIPNAPTTQALVRITAFDGGSNQASDVSNAVFIIRDVSAPSVTVNSPNGTEVWAAASQHNITWTATDNLAVSSITLEYSTNSGGAYTTIATGEANDGTYLWTLPNTVSSQALVRAKAFDAVGNQGSDVSNAVFTIADIIAPTVTLLQPNGGEAWAVGESHPITWTATDNVAVSSITLEYSINGGGNYTLIASGEANDGVYDWVVPNIWTFYGVVRVTAKDTATPQNSGLDVSNSVFTIASPSATNYLPEVLTCPMVLQNRPNPFNPTTRIGFGLPAPGPVKLTVFSASGRLVRRLAENEFPQGYSEVSWNGCDAAGAAQASGVYFYKFEAGNVAVTRRMVMKK